VRAREQTLAERQAQAVKDREEKQRRYEERRKELFGASSTSTSSSQKQSFQNRSGTSSPGSLTPPGSRSATPKGSARGGRGGRRGGPGGEHSGAPRSQAKNASQPRELYDPAYSAKMDSTYVQRREQESGSVSSAGVPSAQQPIRAPKGPDGSGRGGFGFARTIKSVHSEQRSEAGVATTGTAHSTFDSA
jgi:hypothetical protein